VSNARSDVLPRDVLIEHKLDLLGQRQSVEAAVTPRRDDTRFSAADTSTPL
jgi:hypothetical protein